MRRLSIYHADTFYTSPQTAKTTTKQLIDERKRRNKTVETKAPGAEVQGRLTTNETIDRAFDAFFKLVRCHDKDVLPSKCGKNLRR